MRLRSHALKPRKRTPLKVKRIQAPTKIAFVARTRPRQATMPISESITIRDAEGSPVSGNCTESLIGPQSPGGRQRL